MFIPGIIRGLRKGFLEQGVTLVGLVFSVWMAYKFSPQLTVWIKSVTWESDLLAQVSAFAIIVLVVLILTMFISNLITSLADRAALGWLNRLLGAVFAIASTALVLSIFVILFDILNAKLGLVDNEKLNLSILYGRFKNLGYLAFPYLQQFFQSLKG